MVSQKISCQKEEKSESWWCCSSRCQPLTWWHCKSLTEAEAERASCPSSHSMPRGSNLSSLTLLDLFNNHFLKQNALRGITKIKVYSLNAYKGWFWSQKISELARDLRSGKSCNSDWKEGKNWSVGEAGSQSLGPGKSKFCLKACH